MAKLEVERYKPSDEVMSLSQQLEGVVGHNPIGFAFQLANKIAAITQWMEHPEVSKITASLENSQQGFKTDKQGAEKYPTNIRNACVLEALTSGARLNGNEFNIISGQMMIVQNGWRRLCKEIGHNIPGGFTPDAAYQMISFDCHETGEPKLNGNMVTIPMEITYTWLVKSTGKTENGVFAKNITITVKSRDTVDAWIGKAERRILRSFFRLYSGAAVTDDDTAGEFAENQPIVPPIMEVQKQRPTVDPKKTEPKATNQVPQEAEFKPVTTKATPMDSIIKGMVEKATPSNEPPEMPEPPDLFETQEPELAQPEPQPEPQPKTNRPRIDL